MAAPVGALRALLSLNAVKFKQDLGKAAASVQRFNNTVAAQSRKFKAFGKQLTKTGKSLSTNLTLPLALVGIASTKLATDFEASMTKIQTLVGLSSGTVAKMRKEVLALSGETARAPKELADALFTVTSAGLRGEKAMVTLELSAKAAATGLGETKDISRAVTGVLQSYQKQGLSAARATDILVATVREGNLEASELAPVLGRVTGIASQLGVSFEEVGASIATFTRLGVSSEEAVTGLRGIMNALIKPSEGARKALKGVGLTFDQVRNSIKEKGLANTLISLVDIFGDNTEGLAQLIPNVRAFSTVLGTAGAQGEAYTDIVQNITDSQGILDEAFKETTQTSAFKFQQALANLKRAGIEIGVALLPVVSKIADFIADLANKFANLSSSTKKTILIIAGLAAALGPVLVVVGSIATAIGSLLPVIAALTGPIGLVAVGITALGVAFFKASITSDEAITSFKLQQKAVDDLTGNISPLLKRYDELKSKTTLTKNEQVELESIIKKVSATIPSAVSEFNSFGKAMGINTDLAKKFIQEQKNILKIKNAEAIEEQKDGVSDLTREYQNLTRGLNRVEGELFKQIITFTKTGTAQQINLKLGNEEITQIQKRKGEIQSEIEARKGIIAELSGEKTALQELIEEQKKEVVTPPVRADDGLVRVGITFDATEASRQIAMAVKDFKVELDLDFDRESVVALESDLEMALQAARAFSAAFNEKPEQILQGQRQVLAKFISESVQASGTITTETQKIIDKYIQLGVQLETTGIKAKEFSDKFKEGLENVQSGITQAQAVFNGFTNIVQQGFKNQQIAMENRFAAERETIENSGRSNAAKQKAFLRLEQQIEKEKRKLLIEKVKSDKATGIVSAIVNTAVGVTSALGLGPTGIPLAVIVGALGLAEVATIAAQPIPSLATGGVAFGETLALVGEGRDARSNPEVIAPLSKLAGMMDKTIKVIVEGRISGEDLILVQANTNDNRNFIQ